MNRVSWGRFLGVQLFVWFTYGMISFASYFPSTAPEARWGKFSDKLLSAGIGLAISSLLAPLLIRSLTRHRSLRWAVLAGLVATVAGAAAWYGALLSSEWLIGWSPQPAPSWRHLPSVLDLGVMMAAWCAALVALTLWMQSRRHEMAALEAAHRAQQARLELLVSQVRPHFLFNSLNTIRALVEQSPETARLGIDRLAGLLRYTLRAEPGRRVQLDDEIKALRGFLEMVSLRFADGFEFTLDVDEQCANAPVPALLILPLVENAVTHGLADDQGVFRVRLGARSTQGPDGETRLAIEMWNSGDLSRSTDRGLGLGVSNVRERLELLFRGRYRLEIRQDGPLVQTLLELPTGS